MFIESLHIKNVRLFPEINIGRFNYHFNVLAGPSGCGKTSLLACIAHCFSYGNFEYSHFEEDSELWVDLWKRRDLEAYRIGLGAGSFITNEYHRTPVKTECVLPPVPKRAGDPPRILGSYQAYNELQACPLFTRTRGAGGYYYPQGYPRKRQRGEAVSEYIANTIPFLYGEGKSYIKQWLIDRGSMGEKKLTAQEKKNWECFTACLPKIAPPESHFSYIKIDSNLEPVFSVYGRECCLEELPSAFHAAVSLIMEIFIWIEGTMEEDCRLTRKAEGAVLIDDFDIHLDPEWQPAIRQALIDLFPNLQFIVTSHSPHLLASVDMEEVIIMPRSYTEPVYDLALRAAGFARLQTDDIWREIMDPKIIGKKARADLAKKTRLELIEDAFGYFDSGSIPELEAAVHALREIRTGDDKVYHKLDHKLFLLKSLSAKKRYVMKKSAEVERFNARFDEEIKEITVLTRYSWDAAKWGTARLWELRQELLAWKYIDSAEIITGDYCLTTKGTTAYYDELVRAVQHNDIVSLKVRQKGNLFLLVEITGKKDLNSDLKRMRLEQAEGLHKPARDYGSKFDHKTCTMYWGSDTIVMTREEWRTLRIM